MAEVAVKLPKEKLIEGLSTLSFKEIKDIIDSLIQKSFLDRQLLRVYIKKPRRLHGGKNFPSRLQKRQLSGQGQKVIIDANVFISAYPLQESH